MAITLVQKSAAAAQGTTSPISLTLPAGSTAGNLLVAAFGIEVGTPPTSATTTFPAGWVRAIQGPLDSRIIEIWHYINNPGGISSVSAATTLAGTTIIQLNGALLEVAGAATTAPLDRTGANNNAGTTVLTITATTSATLTANNELGVAAFAFSSGSSIKPTLTPGAGWTNVVSTVGTKQTYHFTMDYILDTGTSSGSTLSELETSSIAAAWGWGIGTYKAGAAAAQIWQPPCRNVNQAVQRASTW